MNRISSNSIFFSRSASLVRLSVHIWSIPTNTLLLLTSFPLQTKFLLDESKIFNSAQSCAGTAYVLFIRCLPEFSVGNRSAKEFFRREVRRTPSFRSKKIDFANVLQFLFNTYDSDLLRIVTWQFPIFKLWFGFIKISEIVVKFYYPSYRYRALWQNQDHFINQIQFTFQLIF